MKFIHTSDLHLGKHFKSVNFIIEHTVLRCILDAIKENKPDYLVIAGDIFDDKMAASEGVYDKIIENNHTIFYMEDLNIHISMLMMIDFIDKVKELGCKVLVAAGNHDSNGFLPALIERLDGYSYDSFIKIEDKDEFGDYCLILMPLCLLEGVWPEEIKNKYEEKLINEFRALNPLARNIAVGHLHVGNENNGEYSVYNKAGLPVINASLFEGIDYVALGHIHRYYSLDDKRIYYSGSPIDQRYFDTVKDDDINVYDMSSNITINLVDCHKKGDMQVKRQTVYKNSILGYLESSFEALTSNKEWCNMKDNDIEDLHSKIKAILDKADKGKKKQ